MAWARRALVVLVLAAPVVAVVVVARPDAARSTPDDVRDAGSGPDGELVAGDAVGGELGVAAVAAYEALGDGRVRIGASSPDADLTITVRDADGDELAHDDDTHGLDPEVVIELTDGEPVVVEVRELGNRPTGFTVYVRD